jgi:hypothetical protein
MSNRTNYGPWATTLDDQPRAGLDTFWQRRMAMLPELNNAPSRVRPRTRLFLAVLTMAALATPLVYLSRSPLAQADDAKTTEATTASANPFEAKSEVPPPLHNEFFPPLTDSEKKIEDALERPTSMDFTEVPLKDVCDYLADLHAIPVFIVKISIEDF